jgi:hypothetical protein
MKLYIYIAKFFSDTDKVDAVVKRYMPSGSGFDSGTSLNWVRSNANKLVFTTAFRQEGRWPQHTVTVTPSFLYQFNIAVSGSNRDEIREFVSDEFAKCLRQEVGVKTKIVRRLGEWRVQAYDSDGSRIPEADYYTNDRQDALATAKLMEDPNGTP